MEDLVKQLLERCDEDERAAARLSELVAGTRSIVDEYLRVKALFDPFDETIHAGGNLSAKDHVQWSRWALVLEGLGYAVRALAEGCTVHERTES